MKAGKARYIGISNCFAWQIAKANALAEKESFQNFVSIQGHYNVIIARVAELAEKHGVTMTEVSLKPGASSRSYL